MRTSCSCPRSPGHLVESQCLAEPRRAGPSLGRGAAGAHPASAAGSATAHAAAARLGSGQDSLVCHRAPGTSEPRRKRPLRGEGQSSCASPASPITPGKVREPGSEAAAASGRRVLGSELWCSGPRPAHTSPARHTPPGPAPAAGRCAEPRSGGRTPKNQRPTGEKAEQELKASFPLQGKLLQKSKHFKRSDSSDKNNLDNKRLPVRSSAPELGSLNRSI